jgi:parvulin-like peptidyl-prolyl isomerase
MTTLNSLEQRIREYLLAKKLAKNLFSSEVRELFAQHPSDFEQVLLYRITVPYESLAQEIFYQIEEEEISFYEAAHLYDVNERRRLQCGYEGKQQRRKLSPELTERLFNANVGEVIGPLKSPNETYDLFLVEDFFAPELTREIYEDAIEQRFREWLENELNLYLSSLEEP